MKALSIHPWYACRIFAGLKTIECRTWSTDYRGDLMICSTAKKCKDTIPGHALCVVDLVDVVPFERKHLDAALIESKDFQPGCFAWILDNVRIIRPVPVKGKLSLWDYDGPIEYLEEAESDEEDEKMYHEIWEPLFV